jgi:hypothetical protein
MERLSCNFQTTPWSECILNFISFKFQIRRLRRSMVVVQPGQTIKLQMEEEENEGQAEEEAEGGGGLYRHADLYQKSLATFLDDTTLNGVFMDRSSPPTLPPNCPYNNI